MAMVLEAHPSIEIIEENDCRFHRRGRVTRYLDLQAVSDHRASDRQLIGYKAPRDSHRVDEIKKAFPSLRVLWMERDMRQVVSSMLSLSSTHGSWAAEFAPKEISKYLEQTNDERARTLAPPLDEADTRARRSIVLATLCWLVKREQRRSAARLLGPDMRQVDYDEFVTDPRKVLGNLVGFLGLPWSPEILDHSASIAKGIRPGKAHPERPIDTLSRGKWRTRLTPEDLETMTHVVRTFEANGRPNDHPRSNHPSSRAEPYRTF